ncbi:hypothetical protein ACFL35_17975 [Candidatus Riflebacteria bacterium]
MQVINSPPEPIRYLENKKFLEKCLSLMVGRSIERVVYLFENGDIFSEESLTKNFHCSATAIQFELHNGDFFHFEFKKDNEAGDWITTKDHSLADSHFFQPKKKDPFTKEKTYFKKEVSKSGNWTELINKKITAINAFWTTSSITYTAHFTAYFVVPVDLEFFFTDDTYLLLTGPGKPAEYAEKQEIDRLGVFFEKALARNNKRGTWSPYSEISAISKSGQRTPIDHLVKYAAALKRMINRHFYS